MANLKGRKTAQNLKDAFAGERQANPQLSQFSARREIWPQRLTKRLASAQSCTGRQTSA
jgi:hypothetical protein